MKKEKCFADRKDGECHALISKDCKGCKFYFPRKELKRNPFYEYSYENEYAYISDRKVHKVPEELVMKKDD